jgi:C4-dicarboxylate-specific signal transduction histidine kinase
MCSYSGMMTFAGCETRRSQRDPTRPLDRLETFHESSSAMMCSAKPARPNWRCRKCTGSRKSKTRPWLLSRREAEKNSQRRSSNGNGDLLYRGIVIDVTERKAAERLFAETRAELSNALRLAASGELAGSIVHEVNQPVSALITSAEACRCWL